MVQNTSQIGGLQMIPMNNNNNFYPNQNVQNQNFYQPNTIGNEINHGNSSFRPMFDPNLPNNYNNGFSNLANVPQFNNNYQNKYFNGVPINPNNNNNNLMTNSQ
jgi:hypothetical protein